MSLGCRLNTFLDLGVAPQLNPSAEANGQQAQHAEQGMGQQLQQAKGGADPGAYPAIAAGQHAQQGAGGAFRVSIQPHKELLQSQSKGMNLRSPLPIVTHVTQQVSGLS